MNLKGGFWIEIEPDEAELLSPSQLPISKLGREMKNPPNIARVLHNLIYKIIFI